MKNSFILLSIVLLSHTAVNLTSIESSEKDRATDTSLEAMLQNKAHYSSDIQHTLSVLLEKSGCHSSTNEAQCLKQLRRLDLSDSKIRDISPLTGLTNLVRLDLSNNLIEDVSPISLMDNLRTLYLDFNRIKTIEPLKRLHDLETLHLDGNEQTLDAMPFYYLTNLRELYVRGTYFKNTPPIPVTYYLKSLKVVE